MSPTGTTKNYCSAFHFEPFLFFGYEMHPVRPSEPSTSRPSTGNSRVCKRCGQPMSLSRLERHHCYRNLTERVFSCQCGAEESDFIADEC